MKYPRISKKWYNNRRNRILVSGVPFIFLTIMASLWFFKGYTELGKDAKENVYMPPTQEGFVGKTNKLLASLLEQSPNNEVQATSIDELNRKYPALKFALPYEETRLSYVEDIRLVGIEPDSIKDNKLRQFYFNSRLPILLQRQASNLNEKFFKIAFSSQYSNKKQRRTVNVKKIEVIRSMFKIPLNKDPWSGQVLGQESSLFPQDQCAFLIYGDNYIPINKLDSNRANAPLKVNAYIKEEIITQKNGQRLDYYNHFMEGFNQSKKFTRIELYDKQSRPQSYGWIDIKLSNHGKINIKTENEIECLVYKNDETPEESKPSEFASAQGKDFEYQDGMKIILFSAINKKRLAEFSISSQNPTIVLSSLIESNKGKKRYYINDKYTDFFTQQILRGLTKNLSNEIYENDIHLTIDPLLSKEFEEELKDYLKKELKGKISPIRGERWEISMTVMDMHTGNVIACPYVSDFNQSISNELAITRKNSALIRRYIGSAFKPLLALAAVQTNPSLLKLDTHGKTKLTGSDKALFFGTQTDIWAKGAAKHWGGGKFDHFLATSADVYPVALTALALNGYPSHKDLSKVTDIRPNFGEGSFFLKGKANNIFLQNSRHTDMKPTDFELIKTLDVLYKLNSYHDYSRDTLQARSYLWDNLNLHDENKETFGLDEISPDYTNMRYDEFFVDYNGLTLKNTIVPWVLGQGNNEWNCVKMTESWTRMLTKKPVKASFVVSQEPIIHTSDLVSQLHELKTSPENNYNPNASEKAINTAWNSFLHVFRDAQSGYMANGKKVAGGTLINMYNQVSSLNKRHQLTKDNALVLFSKTGTPDEYERIEHPMLSGHKRTLDIGQYAFALLTESSLKAVENREEAHGIMCVVRIVRTYDSKQEGAVSSTQARNFFSNNARRLDKLFYMTKNYIYHE